MQIVLSVYLEMKCLLEPDNDDGGNNGDTHIQLTQLCSQR